MPARTSAALRPTNAVSHARWITPEFRMRLAATAQTLEQSRCNNMKPVSLLIARLAVQTAGAATLTVSSTADSGAGSLRAALASASAGDTINFTVTGTVLLATGELLVTNNVNIVGSNVTVDGNFASRVFNIATNRTVSISALTIRNGRAPTSSDGGGIYNAGSLTLSNCLVAGNQGGVGVNGSGSSSGSRGGNGGGIYNGGVVPWSTCTFYGNRGGTGGNGGDAGSFGASPGAGGFGGAGGGVYSTNSLTSTACTFAGNSAGNGGVGGFGTNGGFGGTGGSGGGIYNHGSA